jgi:thiol-disulfide isomerase/thioredoxin
MSLKFVIIFLLITLFVTSCGDRNANVAVAPETPGEPTPAAENKSSEYPPLASGLAEADFELLTGEKFKLSDKKGKVLLINIWGTWCGPCRAEMPYLIKMQDAYGGQGFEVIGLNIGDGSGGEESVEQIQTFAASMKLNYTLARSSNAATAEFYKITKQQVVPQSLLVDRQGHLRGVFVGGGQRIINLMQTKVSRGCPDSRW